MDKADARNVMKAAFLEAQVFFPVKEIIKLNILQYQPTGEVFNYETGELVKVDPLLLRKKALEFKVADGSSRLANSWELKNGPLLCKPFNLFLRFNLVTTFLLCSHT